MVEGATSQELDANGDQAWGELKALLSERIGEGLAGKVSTKSIGQMLHEELASHLETLCSQWRTIHGH